MGSRVRRMHRRNLGGNFVRSSQEESKDGGLVSIEDYMRGSIGRDVWTDSGWPCMSWLIMHQL